jgi:hypothetical protein
LIFKELSGANAAQRSDVQQDDMIIIMVNDSVEERNNIRVSAGIGTRTVAANPQIPSWLNATENQT